MHDLLAQKEELDVRVRELEAEVARCKAQIKIDIDATLYELLREFIICLKTKKFCQFTNEHFFFYSELHHRGRGDNAKHHTRN